MLFLVFFTYLVSLLPDYEGGDNFELEITAAGKDLYKQALLSNDPAHFKRLLRSPSRTIVLPPIPGQDEEVEVLQSR